MTAVRSNSSVTGPLCLAVLVGVLGGCSDDSSSASQPNLGTPQDPTGAMPMTTPGTDSSTDLPMAGSPAPADMPGASPAGTVTFTEVFDTVIMGTGCNAGPLCHGGAVGMLKMADRDSSYEALVGVAAMGGNLADDTNPSCADTGTLRVSPGDPDNSLLVQKIDPPGGAVPCGAVMPPTGGLAPEHIELVRSWITSGAAND